MTDRFRAASFVIILALAATAPAGAALVGTASAAPQGFVGVPDAQITEDLPSDHSGSLTADDLRGRTLASDHAGSLEVIVTTPGRAEDHVSNGSILGGERTDVAIVLRDAEHHSGREVALDAEAMRSAFGYLPTRVWGTADDGSTWSSETRVEDGYLVFEVPHFSTQTITFSSEINLSGDPATNGTDYDYEIENLDSASNVSVNMTGETNSEWDNISAAGDGTSVSIGGNQEPTGPADGEPELTLTTREGEQRYVQGGYGSYEDSLSLFGEGGTGNKINSEVPISNAPDQLTGLYIPFMISSDYDETVSIYVTDGEGPDGDYGEGQLVKEDLTVEGGTGNLDLTFDEPLNLSGDVATIEFVTTQSTDGEFLVRTDSQDRHNMFVKTGTVSGVTVESNDGTAATLNATQSGTSVPFDVSRDATNLSVSASGGKVDLDLSLKERTQTVAPGVVLNGETFRTSGTLAEGETDSLSIPSSTLREGQNNVTVLVGDGSLSSDAPAPSVGFDYSHRVDSKRSVSISASKWQEEVNVSRYFPSDRSEATVKVDFAGDVAEITSLKVRKGDSASWQTLDADDYSLDETALTADVGAVESGTNVSISGVGHKVRTVNGSVDVVEPTVAGDDLDTKIEITDTGDGFGILVGPAATPVHYVANPSWSDESYVEIESDGDQFLALPNANPGSTTRVRTAPITLDPTGEIEAVVYESGEEPKFGLRAGDSAGADRVEVTYLRAIDGEDYRLWSVTNEREVMATEASGSTVTLSTGGSAQTYLVEPKPPTSTGAAVQVNGSTGNGGGASPFALLALFAGMGVSIGIVWFVGRRLGASGGTQNLVLIGIGAIVGLVGVEAVTSRSVVSDVVSALGGGAGGLLESSAGAVILGIAILIAIYWIDSAIGLPTWAKLGAGVMTALYVVDGLSGGELGAAIGEIGPLVWLVILVGGIALLWRALKGPTFRIVGRGGGS